MSNQHPSTPKKYVAFTLSTATVAVLGLTILFSCTNQSSNAASKPNVVTKDPPAPGIMAKIGDVTISEQEFYQGAELEKQEREMKDYEFKMDLLNKLMVDKLIGAEAKKAGMSTDDFIEKKVVGGPIKISDADYKKFVAEKNIPESQINPQIKERIFSYMQSSKKQDAVNAYVAKLTKSTPVEAYFKKPKSNIKVEAGEAPFFGKEDAAVTVVEFSDFECPFCARGADVVNQLKKKYGNKIKIAFKQFPLPMHPNAKPAAEASMCVNEQGKDKFWKYHDLLFKNQSKLDKDSLAKWAKEAGADPKKFAECVDAKKYAEYVQKDMAYGEKIGVRSTPTFFINGQVLSGALPIEQFSAIIDEELAAKK